MTITEKDLNAVFTGILKNAREECYACTQEELELNYWFFQYDVTRSEEWNLYRFSDCLEIYKRKCREWETYHNGGCCVVERVRDKYLMPKIRAFITRTKQ